MNTDIQLDTITMSLPDGTHFAEETQEQHGKKNQIFPHH